ncbi:hypothetical protein [Thalassococcus sp. S3]|uniref:hypothetical protein n=1 Tax=Thalassococcus sp. S3 TaxID=2017482 RepID=UPI001C2BC4F2|nr:hypothetical protein [Thalassococcus sp. S3]
MQRYELVGTQTVLTAGTLASASMPKTLLGKDGLDSSNRWRTVGATSSLFGSGALPQVEVIDHSYPRLDGVTLAEQMAITAGFGADDVPRRIWPAFSAFPELISARHEASARTAHAVQVLTTVAIAFLKRPDIILLDAAWWAEAQRDLPNARRRLRQFAEEMGLAISILADGS